MQYRILGGLEVNDAGRPVDIGSPKQRSVLGLLLLEGGRVVSTDQLIDALWGEHPPPAATTSLHTYISNLRRALEPDRRPPDAPTRLLTRAPGYALIADRTDVDWFRFEDLLTEGRAQLAAGRPNEAIATLSEAYDMSTAPPQLDIDDSATAAEIRGRWTSLRGAVHEELLGARLAAGDHRAVVADLEVAVRDHPYDEGLRAKLVLALYRSGRQRDALQALQDARRALADEVGVEPGPELRRLETAVLGQAPELDWGPSTKEGATPLVASRSPAVDDERPPTGPAAPFVGRIQELEALVALARSTRRGQGSTAVVTGEPGIGKTRLVDELAAICEAEGTVVARARCPEDGTTPAFWPVGHHGEQLLASGAVPADQLLNLGRLMMQTRRGDPSAERFAIHSASVTVLEATTKPLLIILDDAQWADTATLRLSAYVAGEMRNMPVLLVMTVRSNDVDVSTALVDCLAEYARAPGSLRIALHGLGLSSVHEWLRKSGLRYPTPSTAAFVHDRTGGNPLFVRELVALIATGGDIAHPAYRPRVVPDAVQDVIRRRIGRLPAVTQQLLVTAAVLGRELALDVLADVAGRDLGQVLDDLDPAFAAGILEDDEQAMARVQFSHVLIAETLAAELSPARRARLHAAIVASIERLRAGDLDAHLTMLAHHAAAGAAMGTAAKAYEYAVAAARQATAQVADEEAARLWERALAALESVRPGDAEARFEVLLELGAARNRAGDVVGARDASVAAAELAIAAGEDDAVVRALLPLEQPGLWPLANYGAYDAVLAATLERAVGPIDRELSSERIRLLGMLAGSLLHSDDADRAEVLADVAVTAARRNGDPSLIGIALLRRWPTLGPNRFADREALAAEMVELDRCGGLNVHVRATGWLMVGLAAIDTVDIAAAEAAAARAREAAERSGRPAVLTELGWFESLLHLVRGRPVQAEAAAFATYDLYRRTRRLNADTILTGVLLGARADQGRVDELVADLDPSGAGQFALVYRACISWASAEAGLSDVSRSVLLTPADIARVPDDYFRRATLVATAHAWWHLGVHGDAVDTIAAGLDAYPQRLAFPGSTGPFLGPVALAMGRLAALGGDGEAALAWVERSAALCERAGMPTWLARSLADQGRLLAASPDSSRRAAAAAVLDRALAVARQAGCRPVERALTG
jgi:DNA-binding SARP family transcriptional activator